MNETPSAEKDALWIEAPREVKDPINAAVRVLEEALDDVTREATWRHLIDQLKAVRYAADRAVDVVIEAARTCPTSPGSGRA